MSYYVSVYYVDYLHAFVADTINGRIIFILNIVYVYIIFCSVNYLFKYSVKIVITKYIR